MPRPTKCRRICVLPQVERFGPFGGETSEKDEIILNLEEYEAIRLIDRLGFTQEECARQMTVARTTVQSIYNTARKKLADALVDGRTLRIEGGHYRLCGQAASCCGKHCDRRECSHRRCEENGGCHHENCSYL